MTESPPQQVAAIGALLCQTARPKKDFLVKHLRLAEKALSQIEQPATAGGALNGPAVLKELEVATAPLRKSILKHGLLTKGDKDIKLLVAICISELFQILAPQLPFEDEYLRDVFKLFLDTFAELGDSSGPYFSWRVKILETVARCKCFVIMLDINCNDLVAKMFDIFFSVVREYHQQSVVNNILSIITNMLNEEPSQPLLDVVLRNLLKEGNLGKDGGAAAQLAVSVIQTCAEKLKPFVCGFLTSCSSDRDAVESELKEAYHEIVFKVFQCAPQMLLAVIPNLTQELLTDQVDARIKAVNLVGKLLALPEHNVAKKYHVLFLEFKQRFSDKSVEVRLAALECGKACYLANPYGEESLEILNAVEDRFLDFDENVRTQAVFVICDLARSNLKFFPSEKLLKAIERLRDRKVTVRKKVLQKLMEVYRDYCDRCADGHMTLNDHFEQIPCKVLMLCYDKDTKEFRSQNMELILAEDLFPALLSVEERTRHWIHLFSLFTPLHIKALNSVLSQKQRLRTELKYFLAIRKKEKDNCLEALQKKIHNSFKKMSASFPEPDKAEECFQKLNQMKDANIFNALELLLDEQRVADGQTTRDIQDKFLKMIGDTNAYFEFLNALTSKCSFNIFSSAHVRCILDLLSGEDHENQHLEASSAKLLLAIISIFPSLLRGSEEQLQVSLAEMKPSNYILVQALAKAGPHISVNLSNLYPLLERLSLRGTRIQAKHAVSAIASLADSSYQSLSKLCKVLVDFLYSGENTSTVLQSLGCIAQHSVSVFEDHDKEIRSYILRKLFQVKHPDDANLIDENQECSVSCKLKIYGLKTLVKSLLPHKGSLVKGRIDELLDILSLMLQTGDAFGGVISCASDKLHIRLAAAKSVLRLSRRWDLYISPQIFLCTILMVKDSSRYVRRSFLDKTHQLLKEHLIPHRYACAFALAASDCCKDLQDASYNYMVEFIKDNNRDVQTCQPAAVQAQSITNYPEYVVVFLLHILAHDPGFPDSREEQQYAWFCSPLFRIVQAFLDHKNDAALYLLSIFRAIKRAEDAVDARGTPKLQILAELGIAFVNALNHSGISSRMPGLILLPSSLYQRSNLKQCEEVSSRYFTPSAVDESFILRVAEVLKSQISLSTSSLAKRGRKCQVDRLHSVEVKSHKLKQAPIRNADSLTIEATEVQNAGSLGVTSGHHKKSALLPLSPKSVELRNACAAIVVCENDAAKKSKRILEKENLFSSGASETMIPSKSQVFIQSVQEMCPLKDNVMGNSIITTNSSDYSTSKLKESYSSRDHRSEDEALIGKRIKLMSHVDRCFYSGTVVGFNPQNNTHKVSYDSGDVELLCLDSESWETIGDSSLAEQEIMLTEESNTVHSTVTASDPAGLSSLNFLKETTNLLENVAPEQRIFSANKETRKLSNKLTSFPAKGRKGRKAMSDTRGSEIINVSEDVVVRRSRRQKI